MADEKKALNTPEKECEAKKSELSLDELECVSGGRVNPGKEKGEEDNSNS